MPRVTIDLTEQQEKYLKEFATKQYPGSKDNVCTNKPIHFVQTEHERAVDADFDSVDKIKYVIKDDCSLSFESVQELIENYYNERLSEECPIPIVTFDEAYASDEFIGFDGEEHVICEEEDYLQAYGIPDDYYYKVDIGIYYETVAVFFILDEAKRYIKYQGHNLTNPRTCPCTLR